MLWSIAAPILEHGKRGLIAPHCHNGDKIIYEMANPALIEELLNLCKCWLLAQKPNKSKVHSSTLKKKILPMHPVEMVNQRS